MPSSSAQAKKRARSAFASSGQVRQTSSSQVCSVDAEIRAGGGARGREGLEVRLGARECLHAGDLFVAPLVEAVEADLEVTDARLGQVLEKAVAELDAQRGEKHHQTVGRTLLREPDLLDQRRIEQRLAEAVEMDCALVDAEAIQAPARNRPPP